MTMTTEQFFDELNKMFGSKPIRNAVANDGIPRKDWARHLQLIKELKDDQDENYVHKEDALEYVMDNMGDDWITDTDIYQDLVTDNDELKEKVETLREERSGGWVKETVHDSVVKENKKLKEIFLDKDDENFGDINAVLQQAEDDYTDKYKMEEERDELRTALRIMDVEFRKENKELRKEIEVNREALGAAVTHRAENVEFRKENKKLREHYDKTTSEEHGWLNAIAAKKFEEYSIENEQLREELDAKEDWVDTNDIAQYWTTPLYEEITTLKKKAMDAAFRSARQIQRLKKKISELEGSK